MRATAVGDVIADRYVLHELIGRGGMGSVWRAEDTGLNRPAALKCARTEDPRSTRRLRREASIAAQLHHPHIVTVFDILAAGPECWLVMEYVPSRSLAQLMKDEGRLAPERVAAVGRQIADALAHSHARGVVHGDITPENILITEEHVAKLTDFGISRALRQDLAHSFTGGLRGKPRYLPPEVANGAEATFRSDMFGLGASLYAAVEGRSPYGEADDPVAYVCRAAQGDVAPPERAGPLTEPLRALLSPDPGERPDAVATRSALARITPPAPRMPKPPTGLAPAAPRAAGRPSRLLGPRRRAPHTGSPSTTSQMAGRPNTPADAPAPADGPAPATGAASGGEPARDGVSAGRRPAAARRRLMLATAALTATALAAVTTIVLLDRDRPDGGGTPGASGAARHPASPPASPGGGPEAPGVTGAAATLGDPGTADPCGLLDVPVLERFGDAELVTDFGAFDRCDVLITVGGETVADVRLNFANDPVEPGSQVRVRRVGKVTVAEPPRNGDSCDRNLGLRDGRQIWITAEREGRPAPDVCELAGAAADHAVRKLNRGPVPRRPSPLPAGSLAHLDACGLLDAAALRKATGHHPGRPDPGIADWDCTWHLGSAHRTVELDFDRDAGLGPEDGRPTTLAGRRSYVEPEDGGQNLCVVRTEHRTYQNIEDRRTTELVMLTLSGPASPERLCEQAEALGATVAAHLPQR
ncbi:serine/threonine-protein kinase [Streptomyces sp. NPDC018031]|uniref:serine/threonine-protein kinase n=1 Tax=Streptomyces sp. NPDC018031 TaxID=3365033 RepID=UPI0037B12D5C